MQIVRDWNADKRQLEWKEKSHSQEALSKRHLSNLTPSLSQDTNHNMCCAILVASSTIPVMQNAILVGHDAIKTISVMAKVLAPLKNPLWKLFGD